jgi:hypothetical protein
MFLANSDERAAENFNGRLPPTPASFHLWSVFACSTHCPLAGKQFDYNVCIPCTGHTNITSLIATMTEQKPARYERCPDGTAPSTFLLPPVTGANCAAMVDGSGARFVAPQATH